MRQCGTNTKHIVAFPLQAWLCQHATMLFYAYIVCLVLLVSHLYLQLKFSLYFSSRGMLHPQSISSIHFIYVCWRTNYETFYYVVSPSYLTSSLLDPDLFFKFFHFDLKFLFFPEAESQGFT